MERFATTVPYYGRYREEYPRAFFKTIAERLRFSGRECLADIGCGPAPLALGFASYVGSCSGIDPEPLMLEAARERASQSDVVLNLIQARIEHLPEAVGPFDVVTIGRALHWMEPQATLRVLDRIVVTGGYVLICAATPPPGPVNPWLEPYDEVRARWVDHRGEERYAKDAQQRFAGSRFRFVERIMVTMSHFVTVEELVRRSLSRSTTSPQVLGERISDFESELAEAIQPFASDGLLREEIHAIALIFQ
jgi:ubiquinone/menaquinone biosynthesis C-methylase UbiE